MYELQQARMLSTSPSAVAGPEANPERQSLLGSLVLDRGIRRSIAPQVGSHSLQPA
jgi:hypothetical protein